MNHHCDGCGGQIREVGKLFKVGYTMLCKECRTRRRMGKMGISLGKKRKIKKEK